MRQGCGTLAGRPTPQDNRIPRENNSRRALCLPGVFCWVGLVQSRGRAAGRPPPTAAGKRAQPVSAAEPPGLRPAPSLPSPGFSWVIAGLRLFLPGLAARRPPAKAAEYRPLPAAAPCKPQGYGPQGRPPQAAVGGRAESPPPQKPSFGRFALRASPAPTLRAYPTSCSRMACSSRFSRRETCTCVIPSCRATSVWVLPR